MRKKENHMSQMMKRKEKAGKRSKHALVGSMADWQGQMTTDEANMPNTISIRVKRCATSTGGRRPAESA